MQAHPDGVAASLHLPDGCPCGGLKSLPGHTGSNLHLDDAGSGWSLNVGFSPALSRSSTLEEARQALTWVALNRVPLPGYQAPAGWQVREGREHGTACLPSY